MCDQQKPVIPSMLLRSSCDSFNSGGSKLRVAGRRLQVTGCRSRVAGHGLQVK